MKGEGKGEGKGESGEKRAYRHFFSPLQALLCTTAA